MTRMNVTESKAGRVMNNQTERIGLWTALLLCQLALFAGNPLAQDLARERNTTIKVPSGPPTPGFAYGVTNAFGNLTFVQPLCLAAPPGETNRLFVLEKAGRIQVITNLANPTKTLFMNISSKVFQ